MLEDGFGPGHSRPENRVDEGLPDSEAKDRLGLYLGFPFVGRVAAVPAAVGREAPGK